MLFNLSGEAMALTGHEPRAMPLHGAAEAGDVPRLESLLAAGAQVDARDALGETPLHVSARNGRGAVIPEMTDIREAVAEALRAAGAKR